MSDPLAPLFFRGSGNFPTTGTQLEAHALEMVYLPTVSYYIGEPDSAIARKYHSFF